MSNAAHTLDTRLRAAAQAIADTRCARVGEAPRHLDALGPSTFAACVEDARAALAAADALPPQPRKAGPVNAVDASALRMEVGAEIIAILTSGPGGRVRAVIAAAGHETAVLDHGEASPVWAAVASVLSGLPADPPSGRQEPQP